MFQVVWPAVTDPRDTGRRSSTSGSRRALYATVALASFAVGAGSYAVMNFAQLAVWGWNRDDRIVFAVAATFAVWTSVLLFAANHIAGVAEANMKATSLPSMSVPMLFPEQSSPETWTQPEMEKGDRLLEADMFDGDETTRVVVLLKPNGVLKGYSGPLTGEGLRLVMDSDFDLPPEPK